ncbi:hypothetical protein RI367_002654 [Sorochytrium milnesiophthora]
MAMPALPRLRHDVYPVTRDVDFKAITLQVQDVDRIYGELTPVLSSAGVQHVRDLYEATRSDDNSFDISVSIPHKDIVLLTLPPGIGSVMPLLGHSNLGWIQFELPEVPKLLSSLRKVEEVLETAQVDAVLHLTQYGLGPSDDPSAWMGIVWKACERKGGTPRGSSLRVVQSRFNDICNILGLYYSTRAPDFADNWWSNPELTTTAEVKQ